MAITRRDLEFFGAIIVLVSAISVSTIYVGVGAPLLLLIRLLALNGFISISIAAITTPFIKETTLFLKRSFTEVHHYFAAAGLVLITLHPIAVVVQTLNPSILLPNFTSLEYFFVYGGSIAIIAIYVAFGGVLLRRKLATHWRTFHMLMYLALFFGIVHANFLGLDLQNIFFKVVYDSLFGAALFAFALKRWQFHRIKTRMKNHLNQQNHPENSDPSRKA